MTWAPNTDPLICHLISNWLKINISLQRYPSNNTLSTPTNKYNTMQLPTNTRSKASPFSFHTPSKTQHQPLPHTRPWPRQITNVLSLKSSKGVAQPPHSILHTHRLSLSSLIPTLPLSRLFKLLLKLHVAKLKRLGPLSHLDSAKWAVDVSSYSARQLNLQSSWVAMSLLQIWTLFPKRQKKRANKRYRYVPVTATI